MDIFVFLSTFFYRIRYKLFYGTILVVVMTVYFTRFLPKIYDVSTTIFTGITSRTLLDDMSAQTDWNTSNNAHDNIINLVKARSTLEKISVGLIAQGIMYGDESKDNRYITAEHYKKLLKITPPEVIALVDKNSFEKTVENLTKYKAEDKNNCIYAAFNWNHEHYSYLALSKIRVVRKGVSDMIEISYESNDPGIAENTLELLNKELVFRYEDLLLSSSSDVVTHFEGQLSIAAQKLKEAEDRLVEFNIENNIINYEEQTKHLAAMNIAFEARYEDILLENRSSQALIKELDMQLSNHSKLVRENEIFINTLSDISSLSGKIVEIEVFGGDTEKNEALAKYKKQLAVLEDKIKNVSDTINLYKFSKEGVATTDLVNQWLSALLSFEKSTAEITVMEKRKKDIEKQYKVFSPVGPNLGRKDREVRVDEEEYITILHQLGLAKLKHKNILLDAGTLQIVTPPDFPLMPLPRKRELYLIVATLAAMIFISGFYLVIEMIDRTIRDSKRAERLTSGKVIGAFPSGKRLKYRQFNNEVKRMAISYLANILNGYIKPDKATIINILSIEPGEGKSYIAQYLERYWADRGFSVVYISHHDQMKQESKRFLQSSGVRAMLSEEQTSKCDIIITEYVALKENNVPIALLKEASVNLLILDAERTWKPSDVPIFDHLRENTGDAPLFIYLNNADREAVEQFTGQLPPYNLIRNLSYRIFNFGITAKK